MIGQKLGHYTVVERIGAGGMGEVYRARDEHLARDVAIKVLPAGTLADEPARRRFRAEAEALARLNHPHIATVHDFATQDGTDFLVMEFVPGSSLADHLAGGSLPEKDVLRLVMQVAAALEEAHENRIVHRDLKPANIRLTAKGDAKVLDFGLAKLLRSVDDIDTQSLTQSQAVVGTLPYMAPEQLRAQPADARTDIYALGCVLYEMATGRRPFRETVSATLTDAILNRPAPSPRQLTPQLSGEFERIILKCLEKDPENRYQSAKELSVDLRRLAAPSAISTTVQPSSVRRWGRHALAAGGIATLLVALLLGFNLAGLRDHLFGPAAPQIDSIAVLPLDNLSGDPEQEYFVEGMHEALTAELSKISALKVISRTSAMRYKGTDKAMPQIARELGVDGVVEGSVAREGDQVRITVQLVHGPTDKHLWAESYQRELRGVLALQSEVARAIAREIRVAVTPAEAERLARSRPVNAEAHELYLKGRYYWNRRTEEGLKKSLQYFQQSADADPTYAPAYAGLADAYNMLGGGYTVFPPDEGRPRAKAAALKALDIDPELSEAYAALALVKHEYEWDWVGAEKEFRRAIELNPSYASAHQWYGEYLVTVGRPEEAVVEMERAQKADPLSLIIHALAGWCLDAAGRREEAVQHLRSSLEMDPGFDRTHFILGIVYRDQGRSSEAIQEFQTAVTLSRDAPKYRAFLIHAYATAGQRDKAAKLFEELKESLKGRYISPVDLAMVHVGLGEKERALEWLERGYHERSSDMIYLKTGRFWAPLHGDSRFQDLLRRMNFPQQ